MWPLDGVCPKGWLLATSSQPLATEPDWNSSARNWPSALGRNSATLPEDCLRRPLKLGGRGPTKTTTNRPTGSSNKPQSCPSLHSHSISSNRPTRPQTVALWMPPQSFEVALQARQIQLSRQPECWQGGQHLPTNGKL